ncbi:MAG: inorganic diphosphatase [bacterium]
MNYIAIIEIPKNSDRRIHKGNQLDNLGKFVDFGLISDKITANNGRTPLAYGFIENTTGSDGEGDEVDVMVFSEKEFKTEDTLEVTPFAMMMREDGDYKVLAHDETMTIDSWDHVPAEIQKILMEFNGFKLPIIEIKGKDETIAYIESVRIK